MPEVGERCVATGESPFRRGARAPSTSKAEANLRGGLLYLHTWRALKPVTQHPLTREGEPVLTYPLTR